jgi:hypothetical protein
MPQLGQRATVTRGYLYSKCFVRLAYLNFKFKLFS